MISVLLLPFCASILAAVAAGVAGTLLLVRHDTYAAAAVSHAGFAGLGLARFLAVGCGLAWFSPTLGLFLSAVGAALFLAFSPLARAGRSDAALSALWAVGMALGLAFLEATPGYSADLTGALFGSVLLVSAADVATLAAFDLALLFLLALFYRGILSISCQPEATRLSGAPVALYETILALATALATVVLVRAVGVVLVVALVSLPALAARRFSNRLPPRMAVASLFALASLSIGLWLSWILDCRPSVPAVFTAALFAALFRPRR